MGLGAPKIPKPNRELEAKQTALLDAQLEQAKTPIKMPEFPTLKPAPFAPPPSMTGGDKVDAEQRARKQQAAKMGYQSTIIAPRTAYGSGNRTLLT